MPEDNPRYGDSVNVEYKDGSRQNFTVIAVNYHSGEVVIGYPTFTQDLGTLVDGWTDNYGGCYLIEE